MNPGPDKGHQPASDFMTILTALPQAPDQLWSDKWGYQLTDQPQAFALLPRQAYDELPAWNASLLKEVWDYSEAHAWTKFLDPHREEPEELERFLVGNLMHCRLLEPEEWDNRYVIIPDDAPSKPTAKQLEKVEPKTQASKAYEEWQDIQARKAWWDQFEHNSKGKQIVGAKQKSIGDSLASAVSTHPALGSLFAITSQNRQLNELTLTWIDFKTGVRCKGRIDALRLLPRCLWIGDLKSSQDARPGPNGFGRSAASFHYDLSAAFYSDGVFFCRKPLEELLGLPDGALIAVPIEFELIAIEKARPRADFVSRHLLTEEQLDLGRQKARRCLDRVVQAQASGWWPGYSTAAQPLQMPAYYYQATKQALADFSSDD